MKGFELLFWGPRAKYTQPSFKSEGCMTYSFPTPSIISGMYDSIYWHPGMRWIADRVIILNDCINTINVLTNGINERTDMLSAFSDIIKGDDVTVNVVEKRMQRLVSYIKNPQYLIRAHFELDNDNIELESKYSGIFSKRVKFGRCYKLPYFGSQECPAFFKFPNNGTDYISPISGRKGFGIMFHSFRFYKNEMGDKIRIPLYFNAFMEDGIVNYPHPDSNEVFEVGAVLK